MKLLAPTTLLGRSLLALFPAQAGQERQGTHLLADGTVSEGGKEFHHAIELWVVGGRLRIDDTVSTGREPYVRLTMPVSAAEATSTVIWHEP